MSGTTCRSLCIRALARTIFLGVAALAVLVAAGWDGGGVGSSGAGCSGSVEGEVSYPAFHRAFPHALTPSGFRRTFGLVGVGDGRGTTIALLEPVDAVLPGSLARFDRRFHLPAARVQVVGAEYGPLPRAPEGSCAAVETMMDLEWAHVVAPRARLVVVVWNLSARLLRRALAGIRPTAVAITETWPPPLGTALFRLGLVAPPSFAALDQVATFAATGDGGAVVSLPAALPQVVAVGGVRLTRGGIRPWSRAGRGGAEFLVLRPAWQEGVPGPWRALPDVVWMAGPPGVAVYASGWLDGEGTSLAAPAFAGLWALAAAARTRSGQPPLEGPAGPILYRLARSAPGRFCQPGGGTRCRPSSGWQTGTGLGWPRPAGFVRGLAELRLAPSPPLPATWSRGPTLLLLLLATLALWGAELALPSFRGRARRRIGTRARRVLWAMLALPAAAAVVFLGLLGTFALLLRSGGGVSPLILLLVLPLVGWPLWRAFVDGSGSAGPKA